ncbi:hypothetical protein KFE25_004833 [Diacronema lutheri]|uniref:Uncharacterized protein n=1 Tax=Diacronema lutheri TaxID=2081491 RepID=A0A8J5XKR0_DIALT|nr:hypothetical protein KFE25_004833 [Diacronema lutheri]
MARVLKAPEIKLAVDLNMTRVASRLMLLNSVVRMERPLATHMSQFDQVKDTPCCSLNPVCAWASVRPSRATICGERGHRPDVAGESARRAAWRAKPRATRAT